MIKERMWKLKCTLMTMGMNGTAHTPYWNKVTKELWDLEKMYSIGSPTTIGPNSSNVQSKNINKASLEGKE